MENQTRIRYLENQAQLLRKTALTMIYEAQSGHPGGSFSAAELVSVLYFDEMNIRPKEPKWSDRDRFVLSKGHSCPVQYAALGLLGYFAEEHLHSLRKENSILQGHPDMKRCPGIDISTGSLGQGVSCAVGMAIAGKRDQKPYRVFTIVGDGECNEGIVWEAIMTAYRYQLDNFILIIDNNRLQLDGPCEQILPNLDMRRKLEDFGFESYDVDGHNVAQLLGVFEVIRHSKNGRPKCINAHTVKGKGVSFMENQLDWHGLAPNDEQYRQAMEELERRKSE